MWLLPTLLALLAARPGLALTDRQVGPYVEAAGGAALSTRPLGPHPDLQGGLGLWRGRYDRAYSLGRYWSLGVQARRHTQRDVTRTAPMLEVRRGIDLFALGLHAFAAAGPEWVAGATKPGARAAAGLGARYRFHRLLGVTLRLEGGAANGDGPWRGTAALHLGLAFARPFSRLE